MKNSTASSWFSHTRYRCYSKEALRSHHGLTLRTDLVTVPNPPSIPPHPSTSWSQGIRVIKLLLTCAMAGPDMMMPQLCSKKPSSLELTVIFRSRGVGCGRTHQTGHRCRLARAIWRRRSTLFRAPRPRCRHSSRFSLPFPQWAVLRGTQLAGWQRSVASALRARPGKLYVLGEQAT